MHYPPLDVRANPALHKDFPRRRSLYSNPFFLIGPDLQEESQGRGEQPGQRGKQRSSQGASDLLRGVAQVELAPSFAYSRSQDHRGAVGPVESPKAGYRRAARAALKNTPDC